MSVLYVTSDQPGAGKTAMCATLAHQHRSRGISTIVLKPFWGGDVPDPDAGIYRQLLGQPETNGHFLAPGSVPSAKLLAEIQSESQKALEVSDVLLIEGTADTSDEASRQLVDALDAKVMVVTTGKSDAVTGRLERFRRLFGERLFGFVINGATRYQGHNLTTRLIPSVSAQGFDLLGVIPEDRTLLSMTIGQLTAHLSGEIVFGKQFADRLVENYMVGGMGLDVGTLYFGLKDNKAVIVRGDRPDIQMAALQTPTACLVLTKGIRPIEYVQHEAELEKVSIVVVQSDTLTTMDLLNSVQDETRFDHPAKLERYKQLVAKHVDLKALYSGLSVAV